MGMFKGSGMNQAPIGGGRLYFGNGRHYVRIAALRSVSKEESVKGRLSFIAECEILQTTNTDHSIGDVRGWVQPITDDVKQRWLAMGSIKQFVAALLNDPELKSLPQVEVSEKGKKILVPDVESFLELATSQANPCAGLALGLVCSKKNETTDFTKHVWHPAHGFSIAPR